MYNQLEVEGDSIVFDFHSSSNHSMTTINVMVVVDVVDQRMLSSISDYGVEERMASYPVHMAMEVL